MKSAPSFAAAVPDVRDSDDLEVHVLGVGLKGGKVAMLHAVAAADDADADAIIGAHDAHSFSRQLSFRELRWRPALRRLSSRILCDCSDSIS